jgi:hypothetical protein
MANANPILDPAGAFSGTATGAAVSGCRILKLASAKTDGNAVPVAHCGATDAPIAASGADAAQNVPGGVTCYARQVLLLEAGGTVTAGLAVEVMAAGKVQNVASGTKVGVAFTSGTNGSFVLVKLTI